MIKFRYVNSLISSTSPPLNVSLSDPCTLPSKISRNFLLFNSFAQPPTGKQKCLICSKKCYLPSLFVALFEVFFYSFFSTLYWVSPFSGFIDQKHMFMTPCDLFGKTEFNRTGIQKLFYYFKIKLTFREFFKIFVIRSG